MVLIKQSLRLPVLICLFLAYGARASDFRPNLGPDLPTMAIQCGDVGLLLRRHSQWTPGRIDFRDHPMTTEKSAYGTVFLLPEVGFIGTNHLENEPEDLQSLSFFLDGVQVEPQSELKGTTFRFERTSKIRDFDLSNTIEIRNHRLYETSTVASERSVPLKLVYHFMHAWRPTVSGWLAGRDANPEELLAGELHDGDEISRRFFINDNVDWIAVYEPESGQFAVSKLLEKPAAVKATSKIWNVPGSYRKYYLTSFHNETVPSGFRGTWKMVTGFGSAAPGEWEVAARKMAEKLD